MFKNIFYKSLPASMKNYHPYLLQELEESGALEEIVTDARMQYEDNGEDTLEDLVRREIVAYLKMGEALYEHLEHDILACVRISSYAYLVGEVHEDGIKNVTVAPVVAGCLKINEDLINPGWIQRVDEDLVEEWKKQVNRDFGLKG